MDDTKIVNLYFGRNELAIEATKEKYGGLCMDIAYNLLSDRQDAEECVNDTYHAVWNSIPPQKPASLKAYLGRVVRNIAISRYRKNTAGKRYDGMALMLSELSECLPSHNSTERVFEGKQLTEFITAWLRGLEQNDRAAFVQRYWYGCPLKEIADKTASSAVYHATRMYDLRKSLKEYLEKEGVIL